ncbi:MAG: transketolase, partial [Lachnospiraceae bacterium]|nr:transketolase [Lachnospiraceae bacterium]
MIECIELKKLAEDIRKEIIRMAAYCDGDAHWGGALSCVDMLAALYGKYLNIANQQREECVKDKFILSKGQSAIALYATLSACGIWEKEYL